MGFFDFFRNRGQSTAPVGGGGMSGNARASVHKQAGTYRAVNAGGDAVPPTAGRANAKPTSGRSAGANWAAGANYRNKNR